MSTCMCVCVMSAAFVGFVSGLIYIAIQFSEMAAYCSGNNHRASLCVYSELWATLLFIRIRLINTLKTEMIYSI